MNRAWLTALAAPGGHGPLELDATRRAGAEIVEGFLVEAERLYVGVVAAGVAFLPPDLDAWIRAHDNVLGLTPLIDPRIVRRLRRVQGDGHDHVPFDEVIAHYRDLVAEPPPGFVPERSPGLGFRMVHSLIRQVDGTLTIAATAGTTLTLTFHGAARR